MSSNTIKMTHFSHFFVKFLQIRSSKVLFLAKNANKSEVEKFAKKTTCNKNINEFLSFLKKIEKIRKTQEKK